MNKEKVIDLLVPKFWEQGYVIVKRKFGKYLNEPPKIGNYEIDILARYKKDYAIGLAITEEDLTDSGLLKKILSLAERKSKFSGKDIPLFIGISVDLLHQLRSILDKYTGLLPKTIKVIPLSENQSSNLFYDQNQPRLFS